MRAVRVLTMAASASLLLASCASMTGKEPMSFFVSSTGSGKGADLGGLAGPFLKAANVSPQAVADLLRPEHLTGAC